MLWCLKKSLEDRSCTQVSNLGKKTKKQKNKYIIITYFHTLSNKLNVCNNIHPTLLHCGVEIQDYGHIKQIVGSNTFVT